MEQFQVDFMSQAAVQISHTGGSDVFVSGFKVIAPMMEEDREARDREEDSDDEPFSPDQEEDEEEEEEEDDEEVQHIILASAHGPSCRALTLWAATLLQTRTQAAVSTGFCHFIACGSVQHMQPRQLLPALCCESRCFRMRE